MEQFTEPLEGQNDGQESAADHPLPNQGRAHSPECTLLFPFRGLKIGANHTPTFWEWVGGL